MNRRPMLLAALPATLVTALAIAASQARPSAAERTAPPADVVVELQPGGGHGDDGMRGPPMDGGGGGGPPRDMGPRDMGPGGPGGGPGRRMLSPSAEVMRNYLELVGRYSEMSKDPTMAGVAATITAADLLRSRGAEGAIAFFEKTLPDVKDESVRRAIRLQLVELYKVANQTDKALEQLRMLMTQQTAAPATQP